jgi:hypothetical protein
MSHRFVGCEWARVKLRLQNRFLHNGAASAPLRAMANGCCAWPAKRGLEEELKSVIALQQPGAKRLVVTDSTGLTSNTPLLNTTSKL